MADHAVAADDRRVLLRAVHHGAVLDRCALSHRDVSVVAPQDGVGPDGRIGADRHVPDHRRIGVDVRIRMDSGLDVAEGIHSHGLTLQGRRKHADIRDMAVATTLETLSPKELGKHLRDVRRRKGLSLSEVARGAGLTRRELNAYEKGRIPIPDSDLFVLAGSCGVDVAELRVATTAAALGSRREDVGNALVPAVARNPFLRRSRTRLRSFGAATTSRRRAFPQCRDAGDRARSGQRIEPAADPAGPSRASGPSSGSIPSTRSRGRAKTSISSPSATTPHAPAEPIDVFEELARLPEPAPLPSNDRNAEDMFGPASDLTAAADRCGCGRRLAAPRRVAGVRVGLRRERARRNRR